jgi:polyferredoxin
VLADVFAIEVYIGHRASGLKPQKVPLTRFKGPIQSASIPTWPTIIPLALLCLPPAPTMWEPNWLPIGIVQFGVLPAFNLPYPEEPAVI